MSESEEITTLDDLTPREGAIAVLGDSPIARLLLFMHSEDRPVTWGEIHRNVEPPKDYRWGDVVDALNRLYRFKAIDSPKRGMFYLNYGPVGGHLHKIIEEGAISARRSKGLAPIVPRVKEGMRLRVVDGEREFYFNGELLSDHELEWWPHRG